MFEQIVVHIWKRNAKGYQHVKTALDFEDMEKKLFFSPNIPILMPKIDNR